MNRDEFRASTSGGKKVIAVSLVLALVLASITIIGAFAAPTSKNGTSAFGSQMRELNFDRAWFNSARLDATNFVRTSDPARAQQYLAQYAFALNQADAIAAGHSTNTANNNNNSNSSSNTNSTNFGSPKGDLAGWLHMMRGLQGKLADIGFTASVSPSTVAGSGVPVTGGTSSSSSSSSSSTSAATPSATPTTSSSSSSSSAATPTAAPTNSSSSSSSSAATPTAAPTTSSSTSSSAGIPNTGSQATLDRTALAKIWGPQFSQLEAARAWLNNFKSNSANLVSSSDPAKTQQWLSQYEFALRQADAIVAGKGTAMTNNNNNNNNNSSNNNGTNFGSAQGDLAQWLHMMRDLQVKLTSGVNGTNSTP